MNTSKTMSTITLALLAGLLAPAFASARDHFSIRAAIPVHGGHGYDARHYSHKVVYIAPRYYPPFVRQPIIVPAPIIYQAPVITQPVAVISQQPVTSVIYVTNSNGSVTPVTITWSGSAWVGPKGEQYLNYPTVEQLKMIYSF